MASFQGACEMQLGGNKFIGSWLKLPTERSVSQEVFRGLHTKRLKIVLLD